MATKAWLQPLLPLFIGEPGETGAAAGLASAVVVAIAVAMAAVVSQRRGVMKPVSLFGLGYLLPSALCIFLRTHVMRAAVSSNPEKSGFNGSHCCTAR